MTDSKLANSIQKSGDAEIDLYADFGGNELVNETGDQFESQTGQENDLYDDVITTTPSNTDFVGGTNSIDRPHESNNLTNSSSNSFNGRRISLYVGQLTWWTTDADLIEAILELDINDLLEVKFHENRVNGQSKGFAVVTVGSDASSRAIQEKIPKRLIHGQTPVVLQCNKQSLSFFEGTIRKDAPPEPMQTMNHPPMHPMMRPTIGLPLPMPRNGPMDGSFSYSNQGQIILPGMQPGLVRGPMQMALRPRGHLSGHPLMYNRLPGQPLIPSQQQQQQSMLMMQRPGVPAVPTGMTLIRPGQEIPPSDPYYRPAEVHSEGMNVEQISAAEFQEILGRNKTVSSSAISRAVQDASTGDFAAAIETLVTAISLIRQSKIANDVQCQILITSLQDTLRGIEDKSYGQRSRHRSPSESSRRKHRHRSRSPRDRDEYRRNEEYHHDYRRR